jgi:hypothetical protein
VTLAVVLAVGAPRVASGSEAPAPDSRLTGTLVADKEPAVGAEVWLEEYESIWQATVRRLGGGADSHRRGQVRTGPNGRFDLVAPELGNYMLRVATPGRVSQSQRLLALDGPREFGETRLERASPTRVDVDAGELLLVITRPGRWGRIVAEEWAQADALLKLDAGSKDDLLVVGVPGQLPRTCRLDPGAACRWQHPPDSAAVRLRIERDGKPLANAAVSIAESGWPLGVSDDRGLVLVPVPREGGLDAQITTADFATTTLRLDAASPAADRPAEPRPVEVPAPTLQRLRLVDRESGAAIAGALVGSFDGALARTDADGRVVVPRLAGGLWIEVEAEGWVRWYGMAPEGEQASIALERAARVVGRVENEAGAAVAGVDIEVRPVEPNAFPSPLATSARSGPDGRFEVRGLDPRCSWEFLARPAGHPQARAVAAGLAAGAQSAVILRIERGLTAEVLVVDWEDAPIASALVRLRQTKPPFGELDEVPVAEAVTDRDGRATLVGLGKASGLVLEASAAGFATTRVPGIDLGAMADGGGTVALGTVSLGAEEPIEVLVVDEEEQPVVGARLWTAREQGELFALLRGDSAAAAVATTDAEGRAVIGGLAVGEHVELMIRAPGFSTATSSLVATVDGPPHVVPLWALLSFSGRVVDERGRPLEGAQVRLTPRVEVVTASGSSMSSGQPRMTQTGKDGTFRFDELERGSASLTVTASDRVAVMEELSISAADQLEGREIVLLAGTKVTGMVRTVEGTAVAEARVSLGWSGAATDANGRFELAGVPLGWSELVVGAEGFRTHRREVEIAAEATLEVELEPGLRVAGRVVDGAGEPLVGVDVRPEFTVARYQARAVQTDASGAFVLAGLEPGELRFLVENRASMARFQTEPMQLETSLEGHEIVVPVAGRLEGQVIGADLGDLATANVVAISQSGTESSPSFGIGAVDFEGRWSVPGVMPGLWTVYVSLVDGRRGSAELELAVGQTIASADIELEERASLRGQVVIDGAPVARVAVMIVDMQGRHGGRAVTDAAGAFEVTGLQPGPATLHLSLEGQLPVRQQRPVVVEERQAEALLIEIRTAGLEGKVIDDQGRAVAAAAVELASADPDNLVFQPPQTRTTSDGSFRLAKVAPGRWRLIVRARGYADGLLEVEVGEGERRSDLVIALEPEAAVTFRLVAAAGPLSQVLVIAVDSASGAAGLSRRVGVGSDGSVRLPLSAGSWRLFVGLPGQTGMAIVDVTAPGDAGIVAVPPPARLAISLEDPPVAESLQICAIDGTGAPALAWDGNGDLAPCLPWSTGRVGSFDAPPGTARLAVVGSGGSQWSGPVAPAAGAVTPVVLERDSQGNLGEEERVSD